MNQLLSRVARRRLSFRRVSIRRNGATNASVQYTMDYKKAGLIGFSAQKERGARFATGLKVGCARPFASSQRWRLDRVRFNCHRAFVRFPAGLKPEGASGLDYRPTERRRYELAVSTSA